MKTYDFDNIKYVAETAKQCLVDSHSTMIFGVCLNYWSEILLCRNRFTDIGVSFFGECMELIKIVYPDNTINNVLEIEGIGKQKCVIPFLLKEQYAFDKKVYFSEVRDYYNATKSECCNGYCNTTLVPQTREHICDCASRALDMLDIGDDYWVEAIDFLFDSEAHEAFSDYWTKQSD